MDPLRKGMSVRASSHQKDDVNFGFEYQQGLKGFTLEATLTSHPPRSLGYKYLLVLNKSKPKPKTAVLHNEPSDTVSTCPHISDSNPTPKRVKIGYTDFSATSSTENGSFGDAGNSPSLLLSAKK